MRLQKYAFCSNCITHFFIRTSKVFECSYFPYFLSILVQFPKGLFTWSFVSVGMKYDRNGIFQLQWKYFCLHKVSFWLNSVNSLRCFEVFAHAQYKNLISVKWVFHPKVKFNFGLFDRNEIAPDKSAKPCNAFTCS